MKALLWTLLALCMLLPVIAESGYVPPWEFGGYHPAFRYPGWQGYGGYYDWSLYASMDERGYYRVPAYGYPSFYGGGYAGYPSYYSNGYYRPNYFYWGYRSIIHNPFRYY